MNESSSPRMRLAPLLSALVLVVPLAACGDLFGPDDEPGTLEVLAGQNQAGIVGTTLANPLAVRVLDRSAKPLRGERVRWSVTAGGGELSDSVGVTDAQGVALAFWTLGTEADETQRVTATAGKLAPVLFNAQAVPGDVAALRIEPDSLRLDAIEATAQLEAFFLDSFGNRLGNVATGWYALNPFIASVAGDGTVTARAQGMGRIVVQALGMADTARVTVAQAAGSLSILPDTAYLFGQGDTLRLRVHAADRNGFAIAGPAIGWQALDPTIVTVSGEGTLQAGAVGSTPVVAVCDDAADTLLAVVRPGIETFVLSPLAERIRPGDSVRIALAITDSAGGHFTELDPIWTVADSAIAVVDSRGWLHGRRDGLAVVTAQVGRARAHVGVEVFSDHTEASLKIARSPHGMVSSAHPLATAVGARVLAEGGNAVDAAVATAFALAVVEIGMSSLAGRTSIVIRSPIGQFTGVDGLNQVPWAYVAGAPEGYATAATPGAVAAWVKAAEEHGTWPLARIVEPAARLAEQGFPLRAKEADRIASAASQLRTHPASARYFLKPDGSTFAAGEIFRREELARVIRAVGEEGAEVFYSGWIADSMHVDMVENGGFITREELATYEAWPGLLVHGDYRGYQLVSNFRPSSGHAVIQALHMMEGFDVASFASTTTWASVTGQAMWIALSDRGRSFGTREESAAMLTSKSFAAERAELIAFPGPGLEPATETAVGTPASGPAAWQAGAWAVKQSDAWLTDWGEDQDRESTTHFSVMDANGGVVAITQSLGPALGTRLAARGLGFLYATRLGSTPGSRPSSTISPTIVMRPDGQRGFVLGAAGDNRIITAVIQVLSRIIDGGLPLDQAMASPRVHPLSMTSLRAEEGTFGWTFAERQALADLGFTMSTSPGSYFGRVHAIAFEPATGQLLGVAEPRDIGGAASPRF